MYALSYSINVVKRKYSNGKLILISTNLSVAIGIISYIKHNSNSIRKFSKI